MTGPRRAQRARDRLLGLSWLAVLAGCSGSASPLTQIVVVVDSDLTVPGELDALELELQGTVQASSDLSRGDLPRSIGLVHRGGPLSPLRVRVKGLLDGQPVVQRSADVAFSAAHSLLLRVPLARACATPALRECGADMTCNAGRCVKVPLLDALPAFDGEVTGFDAGPAAGSGGRGGTAAAAGGGRSGAGGAGRGGASAGGAAPNRVPVCEILRPKPDETFAEGSSVDFSAGCNDPDSGGLAELRWTIDGAGTLGEGPRFSRSDLSVGMHEVRVCASDPDDAALEGCTALTIRIEALPPITAGIGALAQSGDTSPPFQTGSDVQASGTGAGVEPLTLEWSDSLIGSLGSGSSVSMANPLAGKHVITLTVRDASGRSASDSRSFAVFEPGQSQLIAPLTQVNMTFSNGVDALRSDANMVYASAQGLLWRFDASQNPSTTAPSSFLTGSFSSIRDIYLDAAGSAAFIARSNGFQRCGYASSSGIDSGDCQLHSAGDLPSDDCTALLRIGARLLVGTTEGLLVLYESDPDGPGDAHLQNQRIHALAANAERVWIAADGGLFRYELGGSDPFGATPVQEPIPSSATTSTVTGLALGSAGEVWVASASGLARFAPSSGSWTAWHASDETPSRLPSNEVRGIAVARAVNLAGNARDVLWISTASGVSRFDPSIPSFTTFTEQDGLPDDSARAAVVLLNGHKVFATDKGLALYRGQ
jgi:hypothetical protein